MSVPPRRADDTRPRCQRCGKIILGGKDNAWKIARHIRRVGTQQGDEKMMAYQCSDGHWHVGHPRPPYKRRKR